jgi:hypothetical protein
MDTVGIMDFEHWRSNSLRPCSVRLNFQPLIFSQLTVFFSDNKSANSIFRPSKQAKLWTTATERNLLFFGARFITKRKHNYN